MKKTLKAAIACAEVYVLDALRPIPDLCSYLAENPVADFQDDYKWEIKPSN